MKKFQLPLNFTEDTFNDLNSLSKKLDANLGETIAYGLGLLKFVVEALESGNKVVVKKTNGKTKEVEFPFRISKN